nr:nucleotide sugar dehydrogenase [Acidiferrobacterales bacterium]
LGVETGNFEVATATGDELTDSDIAMVCVGTPSQVNGAHNMNFVVEVTRQIARTLENIERDDSPLTLVYRSTMAPGTMTELVQPILAQSLGANQSRVELVYHPEFLRESTAIADYFSPPKIVYGTTDANSCEKLEKLYQGIEAPRFATHFPEAEMTKFVDNSFHGLKVAFANEIGRIAHQNGISAATIFDIFIADTKLNISPAYLRPGGAFGGSCLPKDIRALSALSEDSGISTDIIDNLLASNEAHKKYLAEAALKSVSTNASVLLVGLAFKDNSDDVRESPLLDMAASLLKEGYDLTIYEPHFKPTTLHGTNLAHILTRMPNAQDTIVTGIEDLAGKEYDLLLDGRGNAGELPVKAKRYFDLTRLP